MARRRRLDAGRLVLEEAGNLSNALLAVEDEAFLALAALWDRALEMAQDRLPESVVADEVEPVMASMLDGLTESARPIILGACRDAKRVAHESIRRELEFCESALAARFLGTTDLVMGALESDLREPDEAVVQGGLSTMRPRAMTDLDDVLRATPASELDQALWGPHGWWWRPMFLAQQVCRESVTAITNGLHEQAIEAFNGRYDAAAV